MFVNIWNFVLSQRKLLLVVKMTSDLILKLIIHLTLINNTLLNYEHFFQVLKTSYLRIKKWTFVSKLYLICCQIVKEQLFYSEI